MFFPLSKRESNLRFKFSEDGESASAGPLLRDSVRTTPKNTFLLGGDKVAWTYKGDFLHGHVRL